MCLHNDLSLHNAGPALIPPKPAKKTLTPILISKIRPNLNRTNQPLNPKTKPPPTNRLPNHHYALRLRSCGRNDYYHGHELLGYLLDHCGGECWVLLELEWVLSKEDGALVL
jgi:hypothetical protein